MQGEREKVAVPKPARVPKLQIVGFTEVTEPITEAITKFGGQPVWLEEPRWPLCPKNGKLIPFLGQIKLEPAIFGEIEAKMAYVFHGADDANDPSWPTDHGDSAVVLQPGNLVFTGFYQQPHGGFEQFLVRATGPSATKTITTPHPPHYQFVETECAVNLALGDDPPYASNDTRDSWSETRNNAYTEQLMGHKIGGTPYLWEEEDFEEAGQDRLLLQFESTDSTDTPVPFGVYYGDGGCGWWFISSDGKRVWYTSMCG